MSYPVVPEYITVHLGAPDAPAENVTVTFPRYIKGVAASEIYPTWNESAIRANVLAQISVALNRVYTEFYRSRGYDFDITNNTQYDQAFSPNKETFENINAIVDDMFNNYIVRRGNVEPLYAQFCDGVRTQCRGLSQWGSQELAQQGRTPYEILQYYYGQDIDLVYNAPVGDSIPSYPGQPLTVGSVGEDVRTIQRELNRIRKNYPALPAIGETDGVFGADTAAAVRAFQRIFNLTEDGIVGKSTWYRIKSVYNGVKSLSEVTSEGLSLSEAQRQFPKVLRRGDTGIGVQTIRFYLAFLGFFLPELPPIRISDVFDDELRDAVLAFQSTYGLTVDGVVGRNTWNAIRNVYEQTLYQLPPEYQTFARQIYPGRFLVEGDTGAEVTLLSGPVAIEVPQGVKLVPFTTTQELLDRASELAREQDLLIQAAAPADYRAKEVAPQKIKKQGGEPMTFTLVENPDVAATLGKAKRSGQVFVGFAAETNDVLAHARDKLARKNLDMIVANDVTRPGAGFDVDTNIVTLITKDGQEALPMMSKVEVAQRILDRALALRKE